MSTLSTPSRPASTGAHARTTASALLVVAACLLAPVSIAAWWLRDEVVDTNAYTATVAPLSSNPAIDNAVASNLTSQLLARVHLGAEARRILPRDVGFLAPALVAGVGDSTQAALERFLSSTEFRRVWVLANREAHQALVAALEGHRSVLIGPSGQVVVNLSLATRLLQDQLRAAGLPVAHIPASLVDRQLVIVRSQSLARLHLAVDALEKLAIALPVLTGLLLAAALVLSRERRRTLLRIGLGMAATAALAIAVLIPARSFYLDRIAGLDVPRSAAAAFYDTVVGDLTVGFRVLLFGGLVLASAALLAGPSPIAVRVRSTALRVAGRLADDAAGHRATMPWVAANRENLRTVAIIFGGLVLAASDHVTVGLLVGIGVAVLAALAAIEVLSRPSETRERRTH